MFDSPKNIRDRIPRESKRSKKSEAKFKKKIKINKLFLYAISNLFNFF